MCFFWHFARLYYLMKPTAQRLIERSIVLRPIELIQKKKLFERRYWELTLYMYSKNASWVRVYEVLLYCSLGITSFNYEWESYWLIKCERKHEPVKASHGPSKWIHEQGDLLFHIKVTWWDKVGIVKTKVSNENGISLAYVSHSCEQLNQTIYGIQNKKNNKDVPILFMGMIQINVRLPCLKVVILVLDLEHLSR